MRKYNLIVLSAIFISVSCKYDNSEKSLQVDPSLDYNLEVQGHRGDRGNFPENSIPAFISAIQKGVDVLELDVVISKDKKVVVSHEPYMHSLYMTSPTGDSIVSDEIKKLNLYQMNYDSIRTYDSGSRGNKNFPQQAKLKTYKPLLSEVIDTVLNHLEKNNLNGIKFNIELKSSEDNYDKYQPAPEVFIDLVMEIIKQKGIEQQANFQSFDTNLLNILKRKYPEVKIAYLVSEEGISGNLKKLEFIPEIYSPNFKLVRNKTFVDSIKNLEMKLIPWTVNTEKDIIRMIELEVDGIISDYPERVLNKRD